MLHTSSGYHAATLGGPNDKSATKLEESFPAVKQLKVQQTPLPDYPNVTNELIGTSTANLSFTFDQSGEKLQYSSIGNGQGKIAGKRETAHKQAYICLEAMLANYR